MYEISERFKSRVAAVLAVVLTWLLIAGCGSEPTYDGIGLKRWDQQLDSKDFEERVAAAKGIGHIGAYARKEADRLRDLASADPVPAVRVAAIRALKAIGEQTVEFDAYLAEVTGPLYDTRGSGLRDRPRIGSAVPETTAYSLKGGGDLFMDDDDLDYLAKLEATPDVGESQYDWEAQAGPVEEWPYINPRPREEAGNGNNDQSVGQPYSVPGRILFRPVSGSGNRGGPRSGFRPRTGLPVGVTPNLSSVPGIGKPHNTSVNRRDPAKRRRP
jgi:hypothetical protein